MEQEIKKRIWPITLTAHNGDYKAAILYLISKDVNPFESALESGGLDEMIKVHEFALEIIKGCGPNLSHPRRRKENGRQGK